MNQKVLNRVLWNKLGGTEGENKKMNLTLPILYIIYAVFGNEHIIQDTGYRPICPKIEQ